MGGALAGVAFNYQNQNNFYRTAIAGNNVLYVFKMVNGTHSVVSLANLTVPIDLSIYYNLKIEKNGTKIDVYIDGALILSTND